MAPHDAALLDVLLEIFLGAVRFLVYAGFAGEKDESFTVGLEAGDVGGEGLLGEIGAAGVDSDAYGGGQGAGDSCFLDWGRSFSCCEGMGFAAP